MNLLRCIHTLQTICRAQTDLGINCLNIQSGWFPSVSLPTLTFKGGSCSEGLVLCDDGSICVDTTRQCDGTVDCPDGSDEAPKYCGIVLLLFLCRTVLIGQSTTQNFPVSHRNPLSGIGGIEQIIGLSLRPQL